MKLCARFTKTRRPIVRIYWRPLLALNLGGSITKHEVAQQGKMGLTCAHVHMHRLSELGYFTRVRRTAADGADRPTLYRLAQDDGPTDGQEMAA